MTNTKDTNPKDSIGIKKVPISTVSGPVMMEVGLGMLEGALKYGRHNYREAGVRASVYYDATTRHLFDWWEGTDIDPDSGLNHITKAIASLTVLRDSMIRGNWNDDRPPKVKSGWIQELNKKAEEILAKYPNPVPAYTQLNTKPKKIGLDIDEVLADFVGGMMNRFPSIKSRPVYWNDHELSERFKEVIMEEEFWRNLSPLTDPLGLPFEPHCYITSRRIDGAVTEDWLSKHGFPKAPVYTVGNDLSKVEAAKESGIDIYVDDRYENYLELNSIGVTTYLFDAPHNRRYDVGNRRIKNLKEIL